LLWPELCLALKAGKIGHKPNLLSESSDRIQASAESRWIPLLVRPVCQCWNSRKRAPGWRVSCYIHSHATTHGDTLMNASNRPLEGHRQVVHELGRPARRLIAGRRGRGRGDEEQASVSDCKRYTLRGARRAASQDGRTRFGEAVVMRCPFRALRRGHPRRS
jgi:hypothetical protein